MSVMMLDSKSIPNVIKGLKQIENMYMYNSSKHFKYFDDINCRYKSAYAEELENFIVHLYRENARTYANRYEEFVDVSLINAEHESLCIPKAFNLYQIVSILHCLRYNTKLSEHDDKILNDLILDITQTIVMCSPEYNEVEWGSGMIKE